MGRRSVRLEGCDGIAIPECFVEHHSEFQDYGEKITVYEIYTIPDKTIKYHADSKMGLISEKAGRDLLSSIMEIRPSDPVRKIERFFTDYGFFFTHRSDSGRSIRYRDPDIRALIRHIKELVRLTNRYNKYLDFMDKKNAGEDASLGFRFSDLCFELLTFYYKEIITPIGRPDPIWTYEHKEAGENTDFSYNTRYRLGNECIHDYLKYLKENGKNLTFPYNGPDKGIRKSEWKYVTRKLREVDLRSEFVYYLLRLMESPTKELYVSVFNKKTELEEKMAEFCIELLNREMFNYANTLAETHHPRPIEIPKVIGLDEEDEETMALQEKMMEMISLIINNEISKVIQFARPVVTDRMEKGKRTTALSWSCEDLICAIMLEIMEMKRQKLKCRTCCKEGCPEKGKYYFLTNISDSETMCYDTNCRKRQNKRELDRRRKEK